MPTTYAGSIYVGNSTSTAHQVWNAQTPGRFVFASLGSETKAWDWSGFTIYGAPNSVKFVPDPASGGLQGDFSYGTGSATSAYPSQVSTYDTAKSPMEVDPAGGTLTFGMVARELSYWHKIGPLLRITNQSRTDNPMNISESRTYFKPNTSQYTYASMPKGVANYSPLVWNSTTNSYTYDYVFSPIQSDTATTWQPSKAITSDLTFTCYIGPNNTPYSSYTYIDLNGFQNEVGNPEYFTAAVRHKYYIDNNIDVGRAATPSKVNPSADWRPNMNPTRIISLWQKPNILYYVHMVWVDPMYTDYNNPPTGSSIMNTWTTSWNVTSHTIMLYVEFGISPDGGKDIFWNNATTTGAIGTAINNVYDRGITATVPSDIHKYITPKIEKYSVNKSNACPYTVTSASTHGTKAFKFVRLNVNLSSSNDETHNLPTNRFQEYTPINYKQLDPSPSRYITSSVDSNNNGFKWTFYNSYNYTKFSFQVGRRYRTNDWNLQTSATLYYVSGSMRYEGETNIHTLS